MVNKIYYQVLPDGDLRKITLFHNNSIIAELDCYNDLLGDWEEIDLFLEDHDLYEIYGEDVEFIKIST